MKNHRCTVDLNDVCDHTGLNIDTFSATQIQGFTYSPDLLLNSKKTPKMSPSRLIRLLADNPFSFILKVTSIQFQLYNQITTTVTSWCYNTERTPTTYHGQARPPMGKHGPPMGKHGPPWASMTNGSWLVCPTSRLDNGQLLLDSVRWTLTPLGLSFQVEVSKEVPAAV